MPRALRLLLPLVLAFCSLPALPQPAPAESITLQATPLTLDGRDPQRRVVGQLEWRGGIAITSIHRRFGGFSGMLVEDGGKTLRAISDVGFWFDATLRYAADGSLIGIENGALDLLHGENGVAFAVGKDADAESLTRLADGRLLVGFEREHRILAYPAGDERKPGQGLAGTPKRLATPPGLTAAPPNEGLEAMATLPDGRVLALAEDLAAGPGAVRGWIGTPSGADFVWQVLSYRIVGPFRPTGAAALPNGDVVLTERAYNPIDGVRVRVVRLRAETIKPDALLEPEELARLIAPVVTENLEAIDVALLPDGRIGLWIMADDNFNPMQRTILLHFALIE